MSPQRAKLNRRYSKRMITIINPTFNLFPTGPVTVFI